MGKEKKTYEKKDYPMDYWTQYQVKNLLEAKRLLMSITHLMGKYICIYSKEMESTRYAGKLIRGKTLGSFPVMIFRKGGIGEYAVNLVENGREFIGLWGIMKNSGDNALIDNASEEMMIAFDDEKSAMLYAECID